METIEQIVDILENTSELIVKAKTNYKKTSKARLSKGYLETRIQNLEEYWSSYKNYYQKLLNSTKKDQRKTLKYFTEDSYSDCEEIYLDLKADMSDTLRLLEKSNDSAQNAPFIQTDGSSSEVKLPRINLPTFSGAYEEWQSFEDTFTALIAKNKLLSNVQRLHYLKSCLGGEAQNTIKHIQVTEQNYESAWDTLKSRYSHKRLIVNAILKRLFSFKKVNTQMPGHLKILIDSTKECLNSLNSMDISTASWDPLIIFLTVQKLDIDTHKEWESYVSREYQTNLPTFHNLITFLENRIHTLELTCQPLSNAHKISKERSFHTTEVSMKCKLCNGQHLLCHCKEFIKHDPEKRSEIVRNNRLCYNCLSTGHPVYYCKQKTSCRICSKRHHSLLHQNKKREDLQDIQKNINTPVVSSMYTQQENLQDESLIVNFASKQKNALLATALVPVKNRNGQEITLRALIDPESQASFITENATQLIHLKKTPVQGSITGVGSTTTPVRYVVQLEISSRYNKEFNLPVSAYILKSHITSQLPSYTIQPSSNWSHLEGLILADPQYFMSNKIDLLLGIDVYTEIVKNNLIKGPPGTPTAQETCLGWILFGNIMTTQQTTNKLIVMHQHIDINMDTILKNLWSIDETLTRKLTPDEHTCEEIYKTTHLRDENGRYIVKLPFKKPPTNIGKTRNIALKRLEYLEKKFEHKPCLKEEYSRVMEEYIQLNHMEKVPIEEINKFSVYLPHHAIIRESETTKLRVVFDASCKSSNNVSLNDLLLTGPQLLEDLRNLIMRWRTKKICYIADIQKMYCMILVTKEDTDYQRVLWRKDPTQEVQDYWMLRVTFGTASAPYLAIKTLKQLSEDSVNKFPIGAKILAEDFYVDDCISGNSTVEEAIEASQELIKILESGGFTLQKWASNNQEFLKSIPESQRSIHVDTTHTNKNTIKALGLIWNMTTDSFQYQIKLPLRQTYTTKRNILADIQCLFDPLGWISPAIIPAKILIQNLWKQNLDWDENIEKPLELEWKKIRDSFNNLNKLHVKRWIYTEGQNYNLINLHGFCDASTKAYCATVYYRVITENGKIKTGLIASRTKVAPVKTVSLPRLELCGALLLAKLMSQVREALRVSENQIYAWTDSTVVLSWLAGDPNKWKLFVSNRVLEILENISITQWFHVRSKENPSDIGSRGTLIDTLIDNKLWWEGPLWLRDQTIKFIKPTTVNTEIEMKSITVNFTKDEGTLIKFEEFNTLQELLKTITYMLRFLKLKKQPDLLYKTISPLELEESLIKCIQISQREDFTKEIEYLQKGKYVTNESQLKTLNSYIDEQNILRVGGRLRKANISTDQKYPIILGTKSHLSYLIVSDAHKKTLHGGIQLMLSYIKSKYWIVRVKNIIKSYIHKCIICARHQAKARTQLMGDLPKTRVTPSRPFINSGVDFAGPLQILMSKGRGAKISKAYIAIFVCMSTKAIHLELVGDLTTEAFMGAFNRFVSRRGRCTQMYSDQGRNFIGANKELQAAWKEVNLNLPEHLVDILAADGTHWNFIPAYSPTFGGLWESGVKSTKYHLKRILNTNLTYEEMATVLCQIEACLNSRPLVPIDTADPELKILTPGHFLIGEAPITIPSPYLCDTQMKYLSRWQLTQRLVSNFWKQWTNEYLTRLQMRPKWVKKQKEFEIGDIVLLKEDNLPPGKWALGRILDKHPGEDGLTRVYSIKYRNGIVKRSISKICFLPIDKD